MKNLIPYLVFSGNCSDALSFYADVFRGEIVSTTTFKDAPMPVPPEVEHRIFDSEFKAEGICFKASDDLPNHQVTAGSNISMFVSFSDKEERKNVFSKLAEGGKVLFPLDDNFGMLKDQFNIQWMLVNKNH